MAFITSLRQPAPLVGLCLTIKRNKIENVYLKSI